MNGIAFDTDFSLSIKYIRDISAALGQEFIIQAPDREDMYENTDLMVLAFGATRFACRIRCYDPYYLKYSDEFTIRTDRPSGRDSELSKIIMGWGDFFYYGFENEAKNGIQMYTIADLKIFRLEFNRILVNSNKGISPGTEMKNKDNSSSFRAFKWDSFPTELVVAKHITEIKQLEEL